MVMKEVLPQCYVYVLSHVMYLFMLSFLFVLYKAYEACGHVFNLVYNTFEQFNCFISV